MPHTQLHCSVPRTTGPSGGLLLVWLFKLMLLQSTVSLRLLLLLMMPLLHI